nr:MAG TPA: hypothetical protein [Caudoviricetes sp.]
MRPADLVRDLREGRGRGFWAGQGRGSGLRERGIVEGHFPKIIVVHSRKKIPPAKSRWDNFIVDGRFCRS